jgi:hypothetical protein
MRTDAEGHVAVRQVRLEALLQRGDLGRLGGVEYGVRGQLPPVAKVEAAGLKSAIS